MYEELFKFIGCIRNVRIGVSSMHAYIIHNLNFLLSCSIKNLTLASVSRLLQLKDFLIKAWFSHIAPNRRRQDKETHSIYG